MCLFLFVCKMSCQAHADVNTLKVVQVYTQSSHLRKHRFWLTHIFMCLNEHTHTHIDAYLPAHKQDGKPERDPLYEYYDDEDMTYETEQDLLAQWQPGVCACVHVCE